MIEANKGHIVSVASLAGHIGVSELVDYCTSKFAAVGFNESLRVELEVNNYITQHRETIALKRIILSLIRTLFMIRSILRTKDTTSTRRSCVLSSSAVLACSIKLSPGSLSKDFILT